MSKRKMDPGRLEKWVFWLLLCTLVASLAYAVVQVCRAPAAVAEGEPFAKLKSDYVLMVIQCFSGILVVMLPSVLERKWKLEIPSLITIMYFVFLYCAIYLGEVRSFYFKIPYWDMILHTFSGLMIGSLGFSVVNLLNKSSKPIALSPLFVAVFAFCFALGLGVLWEIYEFTMDGLMQTNMQKFALENGTALLGREALADTMEDLIVDAVGALVMSVIGYLSLKRNARWMERMSIRRRDGEA